MNKSKNSKIKFLGKGVCAVALFFVAFLFCTATQASAKEYKVTPKSTPINKNYQNTKDYNTKTKAYFTLRSYLEKLQKDGGGTLVLGKGKYKVCSTLYVPSDVTIKLKKGAILVKTNDAGSSKVKVTKSLFECVAVTKTKKKDSVTGYKGSKNITFIGEDKSYIDLGGVSKAVGIGLSHNYDISISKIRFRNMNGGTYIGIAGSKKVTVQNCLFMNGKAGKGIDQKYAIRMEATQKRNDTFGFTWSKKDNTTNLNIKIMGNQFLNLNSAIGTSRTSKSYQTSVVIYGNKFKNIENVSICAKMWKSVKVRKNTFLYAKKTGSMTRGFYGIKIYDADVTLNTFNKVKYPIVFENADGKNESVLTQSKIAAMAKNTVTNATIYYASYVVKKKITRMAYFVDKVTKNFTMTVNDTPFQEQYLDDPYYNSATRNYYVLRSYMEQLESVGGGTVTITKGTYSLSNCIFIPSNVTIYFNDGVSINKVKPTSSIYIEAYEKARNGIMFMIVPPSKAVKSTSVGGYNGSKNVKMIGRGSAKIDLMSMEAATGIVTGHADTITIQGLSILNVNNATAANDGKSHFMEINSSQNVTVADCTFKGHVDRDNEIKEAINIDNTDANTGGFSQAWAIQDKTMCNNIIIKNNVFDDIERAIGSHMYSASDSGTLLFHTGIQILNNTFKNSDTDQIYVTNWMKPIISGNTFENIAVGTGDTNVRGIRFRNANYPTITNNKFVNVPKAFQIYFCATPNDLENKAGYITSYTTIDYSQLASMIKTNSFSGMGEEFVRVFISETKQMFYNFNGVECDKDGKVIE